MFIKTDDVTRALQRLFLSKLYMNVDEIIAFQDCCLQTIQSIRKIFIFKKCLDFCTITKSHHWD